MSEIEIENWEPGVLYRVFLVQQELPIFEDYDYSPQWEKIEKALEMDMKKKKVFNFVHPKIGKKGYTRKYTKCPENGNTELVVGTMKGPLDFTRIIIVLHSHIYKVPYIALERYKHISNNPDIVAKMVERSFNWILEGTGVKMVLKRWDTKGKRIYYHEDSDISYDIELEKCKGKNLIRMGYEDAFEIHMNSLQSKKVEKPKSNYKSDKIEHYVIKGDASLLVKLLHLSLRGKKSPCDIARSSRFLGDEGFFDKRRLPFNAFISECNEVEGLISKSTYNNMINPDKESYEGGARNEILEEIFKPIL